MKSFIKFVFLFCTGGLIYVLIELLYRGCSDISMFILAGLVFISIGLINKVLSWETPLTIQAFIGCVIATFGELITGLIVNVCLGLNVWDYSNLPFNFLGQVCLYFSIIWYLLSIVCILLDDLIRWKIFGEEKPHYKIF